MGEKSVKYNHERNELKILAAVSLEFGQATVDGHRVAEKLYQRC